MAAITFNTKSAPNFQFKQRTSLQRNSSLRNYCKRNLIIVACKLDNFTRSNIYFKIELLTKSEKEKLSEAQALIKDVLDNYKEEYFKNRDLFK